ncbi:MAG: PAS domain-containing sensor histidine kinase, partial [Desulfobacterales bacterium]
MVKDIEKEYLLKAIGAFKRRFIVVSPDFKILASNCRPDDVSDSKIIGKCCYEVFYERSSPCENCAVKESIEKRKPTLMPKPEYTLDIDEMPCYFSYPIYSGDNIEAFVSMDFDLPTRGGLEEKLQRSNAFLRNLIFSAVDGV